MTETKTAGTGYRVYAATSSQDLEGLRGFWEQANRHPDAQIDFFSLVAANSPQVEKPYVLVAAQNGSPQALLVGRLERYTVSLKLGYWRVARLPIRQLNFIQESFLGDCHPPTIQALLGEVMACLNQGVADRAVLCNLEVGSAAHEVARRAPSFWLRDYSNQTAQRWRTQLPGSLDEFLRRRSKKHRYWLRRIGRVFDEEHAGRVRFEVIRRPEEVARFCAEAEKVAQSTYQRGLGVGFVNQEQVRRRLDLAAARGWLRAYLTFVGDEPVAFWCGSLYKGVMYLDSTGYKPAYRDYEVGTILFLKMVEELCQSGASEIDYGTGASFYKERFGDQSRNEGFVAIHAATWRGFAAAVLKTLDALVNRSAKFVASHLGVLDRIKRRWRGRLAGTAEKAPASETVPAAPERG
jgi:CelD/BcsL family acetyltransferase involved in cellulose biosynthesis